MRLHEFIFESDSRVFIFMNNSSILWNQIYTKNVFTIYRIEVSFSFLLGVTIVRSSKAIMLI